MVVRNESKKRGMFVYVVRWANLIDGEDECGNFEVCYTDEKDAEKAMLADMEDTKSDCLKGWPEGTKSFIGKKNENGCSDFCSVEIEKNLLDHDYYEWYIDKLELVSDSEV